MHVPYAAAQWDEHRNTSRVFPVPPGALQAAERALERLRAEQPALVAWIAEGAPTLSEAEHLARFGEPYQRRRGR